MASAAPFRLDGLSAKSSFSDKRCSVSCGEILGEDNLVLPDGVALATPSAALGLSYNHIPTKQNEESLPESKPSANITFYKNARLIEFHSKENLSLQQRRTVPKRGRIGGYSARSRSRMMQTLAKLVESKEDHGLFVTLTYPSQYPADPETWKDHLERFFKWIQILHPLASAIWKLEPQRRGAPHFHLLLFGVKFLHAYRASRMWAHITGSTCPFHARNGVDVKRVRSRDGVMSYASKLYMGKEIDGKEFKGVGRFWGVKGRKHLPVGEACTMEITPETLARFKRYVRRFINGQAKARFLKQRARGQQVKLFKCRDRFSFLFAKNHLQWLNLLEHAHNEVEERKHWPF